MKIIVVCGPTAVGKTKTSIDLAKAFNGEIINADSMQIYKDMNIGTAKITEAEKENIKHHMFDICNLSDDYSVANYQKDTRKIIDDIVSRGKTPILVGGTGLYIKAVLYDYQFNHNQSDVDYEKYSNENLYEMIESKGLEYKEHINNRKRMINVLKSNGLKTDAKVMYPSIFIGLTMERTVLYQRIEKRVEKMFDDGLEKEAIHLLREYPNSRALDTAIGYKEFKNNNVIEEIKKNTRHYAKKQYTWFNRQLPVTWFDITTDNYLNEIIEFIKK